MPLKRRPGKTATKFTALTPGTGPGSSVSCSWKTSARGWKSPSARMTWWKRGPAKLIEADLVVWVTSLYYYGINAALKAVINRFYTYNHELHGGKQPSP